MLVIGRFEGATTTIKNTATGEVITIRLYDFGRAGANKSCRMAIDAPRHYSVERDDAVKKEPKQ